MTTTCIPIIKPFCKYPGAKWRIAAWIVSLFPPHLHYVEPYAGSAACFFVKTPAPHEVLNDLNGSMCTLFRVLRERCDELAEAIALTPWSEEEYIRYERDWFHEDDVEHARRFLVRLWQAHGGTISQTSGWKHNGLNGRAYPVRLWRKLPERLLATVDRLRDAEIRQQPALNVIRSYDAPNVLLYVDPPYLLSTRARKYYEFEMTDADHVQLLDTLDAHKGMVLVSGYAHPFYDERLAHWQRLTLPSVAEHGKQQTEVLWLNPRAFQRQQLSLFEEKGVSHDGSCA